MSVKAHTNYALINSWLAHTSQKRGLLGAVALEPPVVNAPSRPFVALHPISSPSNATRDHLDAPRGCALFPNVEGLVVFCTSPPFIFIHHTPPFIFIHHTPPFINLFQPCQRPPTLTLVIFRTESRLDPTFGKRSVADRK